MTDSKNSPSTLRSSNENQTPPRREPSAEARTAGQAALSRLEGNKPQPKDFNVYVFILFLFFWNYTFFIYNLRFSYCCKLIKMTAETIILFKIITLQF